jgi:hypothetical protein
MQCGLSLSLFVDQPTISSISTDKEVNENDTTTITCTVDSIPVQVAKNTLYFHIAALVKLWL